MEVIKETLWKRCLSSPTKPPAKNSKICLSETAYQHKETRKKCKKTNQAAIIQWQRQCLMYKTHRKPWPKSKTSDISKQSPSPLHHTFLLESARFTSQPLSALVCSRDNFAPKTGCLAWVQSSIVQLLSHCFASLSLHGILIDQGENDPLKIRQKKSLRKSTYSRTFSKIIIKQQLQWLPARVRYCRINIFKTVFKYSFLISFLNISFDISVCRRNSLHICSHLSAPFKSVVKV